MFNTIHTGHTGLKFTGGYATMQQAREASTDENKSIKKIEFTEAGTDFFVNNDEKGRHFPENSGTGSTRDDVKKYKTPNHLPPLLKAFTMGK